MDSNQQQVQHGLEPSSDLFNPQQDSGVANAGIWKAFSCSPPDKLCSSSSTSSKAVMMPEPPADFYRPDALLDAAEADENLVVTPDLAAWQAGRLLIDEYSSLRCLLPGAAAVEQPRQGLSLLSLCKAKGAPDTCRLQQQPPFDLREGYSRQQSNLIRDGLLPRTSFYGELVPQQQYSLLQESHVFFPQLGTASSSSPGLCSINAHQCLRNSQYLAPAQELLNEVCCVKPSNNYNSERPNHKPSRESEEGFVPSSCAQRHRLLLSLDIMELKKRMGKLISMLEELDRRYRKYCEQMKALTSSLEAVAGEGTAGVYTALASKAMSRHFRCLRDGIVGQISETRNAIGEKDPVHAPGMTRGETPRLRLLVRYVGQQKAMFQHAGASSTEAHPWRPQRGLPERSVSVLRAWLFEHFLHPYPSDVDKHILARQTGLSRSQVCNWFINARVRLWKPMVEEMYSEETSKELPAALQSAHGEDDRRLPSQSPIPNPRDVVTQRQLQDDKKPAGATTQLLDGSDADSLSSVVVGGGGKEARFAASRAYDQVHQPQQPPGPGNNFGALDVDFPSGGAVCSGQQNFANSTASVSLTLGLQQNDGAGVSFSFMPPSSQSSLLLSREAIDHNYQPMQFSILDGDIVQNPPYRNFVGAQVLHDLTG